MSTRITIDGAGGEFTHKLDLLVDESQEYVHQMILHALAGTQNTREIILSTSHGKYIIPAKVLHHSVIKFHP